MEGLSPGARDSLEAESQEDLDKHVLGVKGLQKPPCWGRQKGCPESPGAGLPGQPQRTDCGDALTTFTWEGSGREGRQLQ